jgi:hypothetical protein
VYSECDRWKSPGARDEILDGNLALLGGLGLQPDVPHVPGVTSYITKFLFYFNTDNNRPPEQDTRIIWKLIKDSDQDVRLSKKYTTNIADICIVGKGAYSLIQLHLCAFCRHPFAGNLKGLSHQFETGCRWYGCVDLYLEKCCCQFINFLVASSIFNSN